MNYFLYKNWTNNNKQLSIETVFRKVYIERITYLSPPLLQCSTQKNGCMRYVLYKMNIAQLLDLCCVIDWLQSLFSLSYDCLLSICLNMRLNIRLETSNKTCSNDFKLLKRFFADGSRKGKDLDHYSISASVTFKENISFSLKLFRHVKGISTINLKGN